VRPEAVQLLLSPEVARELRATSPQTVRDVKVNRFLRRFGSDWNPTVHRKDPIIVRAGVLENGNHRCEAVSRSGLHIPMFVRHYPSHKDDPELIRRLFGALTIGPKITGMDEIGRMCDL
jgi:hypothetical protein